MTIHTITALFSSDTANGALNVNTNSIYQGNSFSVDLSRYPINIPNTAKSCTLSVISASIPYVSPNIIETINSEFYFEYLGLPSNLFSFIGNGSTQKVSIVFNFATLQIDFTQSNTFRNLLGFASALTPPLVSVINQSVTGTNIASFDTLQSYTIMTNLVTGGIPINNVSKSVIANIPINATPGSRIVYDPQNVSIVNCTELIGYLRTNATFTIGNQKAENINMLNEIWSITIKIIYED